MKRLFLFGTNFEKLPPDLQRQIFLQTTQHSIQEIANIVQKIDSLRKIEAQYIRAVKDIKGRGGDYYIYTEMARSSPAQYVRENAKYILNNHTMPRIFKLNTVLLKTKRKIKEYKNEIDNIKDQLYFNYGHFKRL